MTVIRAWDTEAVVKPWCTKDINPLSPEAWLVAHAWSDNRPSVVNGHKLPFTKPTYRYFEGKPEDGWFKEVLSGADILTGANIKFDLLLALMAGPKNRQAYRQWVNKGGRIWDILLAEYLLDGHTGTEAGAVLRLNNVAVRYGGNIKHDQVAALIDQGTPVNQIDKSLLLAYLCGEYVEGSCTHGDIGNTMLACLGQLEAMNDKPKLREWCKVEMLALQCTTEMEFNGIHIDWEKAEAARGRALEKLDAAKEALRDYLPAGVEEVFSWGSWKGKSLLLYGGVLEGKVSRYIGADGSYSTKPYPEGRGVYAQKEVVQEVLDDQGNLVLYASGKNKGLPKTKKVKVDDYTRPKKASIKVYWTFPRRIEPMEGTETSEEGYWKTDQGTMDLLPEDQVVDLLREVSTWSKDISVSYYTIDEKTGEKTGGFWAATDNQRLIHPSIHHTGTVSGRLSSSSPNCQNVSKVGEIKTCLTSRYPGGKIIQGDYTSLENYVMLWLSGCPGYYELLHNGYDTHSYVAASCSGVDYKTFRDKFDAGDKGAKQQRQDAKQVNFTMAYGGGYKLISYRTRLSEDRVKEIMEANKKAFHGYWAFQDRVYREISTHLTFSGDVARHPADQRKTYRKGYGTWVGPQGISWRYPLVPTPKHILEKDGIAECVSPTQSKNLHVQGTGASAMKAALAVQFLVWMAQPGMEPVKMIMTVHDAAYWDAPGHLAEKAGCLQLATLLEANEVLTRAGIDVKIPVPAVVTVGDSWKEQDGDLTISKEAGTVLQARAWIRNKILPEVFA